MVVKAYTGKKIVTINKEQYQQKKNSELHKQKPVP